MTFSIVSELPEERCLKLVGHYFGLDKAKKMESNRWTNCDCFLSINTDKVKTISKKLIRFTVLLVLLPLAFTIGTNCSFNVDKYSWRSGYQFKIQPNFARKKWSVYSVEASYTPYMEPVFFTVYFGTDKSKLDKALKLIKHELERMRSSMLSATAVKSAKKQLLGQLAISMDNPENLCLSMGKSLLAYNKVETIDYIREKIEETTAEELQQIASEIFSEEKIESINLQIIVTKEEK
jgi:hypothetical protein